MSSVVDLGPVEVDDGRSRAQLTQGGAHALVERLRGHVTRSAQGGTRQPGSRKTSRRDDRRGHAHRSETLKVGGDGLPLGGRGPTLHGQQVHDTTTVGNRKAHHVGRSWASARPESRDRRGRR